MVGSARQHAKNRGKKRLRHALQQNHGAPVQASTQARAEASKLDASNSEQQATETLCRVGTTLEARVQR